MAQIIKAKRSDKQRVLDILVEAFWDDPHVNWFTGQGKGKRNRMRAMMSHAFEMALPNGDVYLSEDKQAVAIWKTSAKKPFNRYTIWENLNFLYHFGLKKVRSISAIDKLLQASYPQNEAFYYLFIIGTTKQGRGKGLSSKLMNHILEEADKKGIPTYLETANAGNIGIYNRKEFYTQSELRLPEPNPITLYLMSRAPQKVVESRKVLAAAR